MNRSLAKTISISSQPMVRFFTSSLHLCVCLRLRQQRYSNFMLTVYLLFFNKFFHKSLQFVVNHLFDFIYFFLHKQWSVTTTYLFVEDKTGSPFKKSLYSSSDRTDSKGEKHFLSVFTLGACKNMLNPSLIKVSTPRSVRL